jgi:hypothetical protein
VPFRRIAQRLRASTFARWGSPAWLAGLSVTVALPGVVHLIEYGLLRAGHVSHIRTAMIVSVALSIISLLLNWGLMRRGLLVTGKGAQSLAADFQQLPATLGDFVLAGPRVLARFSCTEHADES